MILCFPSQVRADTPLYQPFIKQLILLGITNPFYLLKTEGVYCKIVLGSKDMSRSLMKNQLLNIKR